MSLSVCGWVGGIRMAGLEDYSVVMSHWNPPQPKILVPNMIFAPLIILTYYTKMLTAIAVSFSSPHECSRKHTQVISRTVTKKMAKNDQPKLILHFLVKNIGTFLNIHEYLIKNDF